MRQELLWIPHGVDTGAYTLKCDVPYSGKEPDSVWTLPWHTDPDSPPELPFAPKHFDNAFYEDRFHDWTIRDGVFRYRSRVSEGHVWVLLEFKDESPL